MKYPRRNADRATYWLRKIDHSTQFLKPFFEAGDRIRRQYENKSTNQREEMLDSADQLGLENIGRIKPSIVFYWIDQSIANQLFREPTFRVTAKLRESVDGATVVGKVVNHWQRETRQKEQDKRCLLDAYTYPYGIKKVGWSDNTTGDETLSDMSDIIIDDPEEENLFLGVGEITVVTEDQDSSGHIKSHNELLDDPEVEQDLKENVIIPHIEEHEAIRDGVEFEETHEDVEEDQPYGVRWDPTDFRFDPMSTDGLKDARWVAFRSVKTLEEVQANPNYKNTKDLQATSRLEGAPDKLADGLYQDGETGDDFGVVVLWEIWARRYPVSRGKHQNLLIVIAEQQAEGGSKGKVLRHDTEWPYKRLKSYPCELLCFHKSPLGWVSNPMLNMAGSDNIQGLVNEMLDSWLSAMRKQKNMIFYDSNVFTEDQVEIALETARDAAIPVQGLAGAQGNPILPLPYTNISPQKAELIDNMFSLFNMTAGTPGPGGGDDETATEAAINERRTTAREAMRSDEFEQFQIGTAEAFWALHTQFLAGEEFPVDPDADEWATVDGDVVRGSYRFDIDVASHATAQAIERKQWMDLLNLLAGIAPTAMQMGMPPPNLPWLAEQLMVRGYEIQNPEEVWPAIGQEAAANGIPMPMPGGPVPNAGPPQGPAPGPPGAAPTPGPALPAQFSAPVPSQAAIAGNAQTL